MKILVLSTDYPDKRRNIFVFVKQFVDELARMGHNIQVVAPYSLTHNRRLCKQCETIHIGIGTVTIYRPFYFSFSNWRIGKFKMSSRFIRGAFRRGISMLKEQPDVVYGHFWPCAYAGYDYARERNLPLFVATGESVIDFRAISEKDKKFCDYLSGTICVSSKNRQESIDLGLTSEKKCVVIPNAVNPKLFHVMNRKECRRELRLPQDVFIIIYVGWFDERKGVNRVVEAIKTIKGMPVYSIFIGGKEPLNCPNVLITDRVPHEDLPIYLNAADVFVLPTLHEGCCNAIIEALACGLPIISSDLPFNQDILHKGNSILVNPIDISELASAITLLRDDKKNRQEMSRGSLESVKELSIHSRAEKILAFIASNTE